MNKSAFIIALLLTGCGWQPNNEYRTASKTGDAADPMIYTDQVSRCQYLSRGQGSGGLTPRIAADGHTHMGCGGVK